MTKEEQIKEPFFKNVTDWENYLPLMYYALQETKGDVVECGVGNGGSIKIHDYCEYYNRMLHSFETDEEWMKEFLYLESDKHKFHRVINNWHIAKDICPTPSVVLVDNAPGSTRRDVIKRFAEIDGILIVHDVQGQPTAADYGFETCWPLFKYKVDLEVDMNYECDPPHNRTWAAAISNVYDVTKWVGLDTGRSDYRIVLNNR